jgi:hypothetical protein
MPRTEDPGWTMPAGMMKPKMIATSVLGGLLFFLLTYGGVLHAIVSPPPGFQPAYSEQTLDMGAYWSWLADSKDDWLLPNRHVPYSTEAALFQPMVLSIAKTAKLLHVPVLGVFYALQILLFIGAFFALLFCAQTYLAGKRDWIAAACIVVCSLPFSMYLFGLKELLPITKEFWMFGVIAYAYQSSDGLFRAGLSNGPNLTFGTMTMLLAFAFLGRYVKLERRSDFVGLCVCAFANALLHPFEVYVFVTTALVSICVFRYHEGRLKSMIPLAASLLVCTAVGMLPYLVQTARSQWMRDVSDSNQYTTSPALVLADYGLPTLAVFYLLLLRWRMQDRIDLVLRCWVLISCLLVCVPAIPCGIHLFDGFVYGQALLLVRRAKQDTKLPIIFQKFRRPALATAYILVGWSVLSLGAMWLQIYGDGVSAAPAFQVNALQSNEEGRLLQWLKSNALQAFLERYGFRYAVVPASSKLAAEMPGQRIQRFGPLDLYLFPDSQMKAYPAAGLVPERGRNSMRQAVFSVIATLFKSSRPSQ